jgi:tetratricopeptide (TPR) repeat protein
MAKRLKTIGEVYPEGPRSGKTARCTTLQSVIERPTFHAWEIIIYGLLILLLMTGSYWRNRVWKSELELWTDCVKKSPNKARPHNNLGTVFLDRGKYQEAIPHLNEALRINPNYAEAHYNLGDAYFMTGNRGLAMREYEILKTMNPALANALYQKIK